MDPVNEFQTELEQAGLIPGEVAPDGRLRRCGTTHKPKGDTAWHVLFEGPPVAGAYGDWARGFKETFCQAGNGGMDPETRRRLQDRIEKERQARQAEQEQAHKDAAQYARQIIESLPPATAETPYFKRKGVAPSPGIREDNGTAVVPIYGPDGAIMSLQRIKPDGEKRFLTGGKTAGGFFPINKHGKGPLIVCEGIATGLSLHEADGTATVLCAYNAGNLEAVSLMARERYPDRPIVIAADDDAETEARTGKNPGKLAAEAAAQAVGAKVALPVFQDGEGTDFNDLHQEQGLEAVKTALEQATEPPAFEAEDWPDPVPLPDGLPPVATFELALLPEVLKPWAGDIADRMQCPLDYVAVAIMAALGAVIGRKIAIRPQASTDWTVTPNSGLYSLAGPEC